MIKAKDWAKGKNCYFETDKNNKSWLWLSNGHVDMQIPMRVSPNDVLGNHTVGWFDRMYRELQNNYILVDLDDGCALRVNGIEQYITGF